MSRSEGRPGSGGAGERGGGCIYAPRGNTSANALRGNASSRACLSTPRIWRSAGSLLSFGSLLLLLCVTACSPKMSWQVMAQQPRAEPYENSRFFPNGSSAQPLVEGVVARGTLSDDELLNTGRQDGELSEAFPFVVDAAALERGRERYNIFCTPCHDAAGMGSGMAVRRGYTPPPPLHSERLRAAPAGYFFDVITNGFGAMPSYADQVPPLDRWAIVAYVRALQLSQNAALEDVPPAERDSLAAPEAAP